MTLRGEDGMRLIVFSAIGSVPLHIAAVLVFAGGPGTLPPEAAGLVSSAILGGQFVACLAQALGFARPLFALRLAPLVFLQAAMLVVLPALPFAPGLVAWFVVGWISGIFMYKGMVAAARARSKYLGFLARLVAAMTFAGAIALGVSRLDAFSAYGTTCFLYAGLVCLVYFVTRPSDADAALDAAEVAVWRTIRPALAPLLPLVLFFIGGLMVGSHLSVFVSLADMGADPMLTFGLAKIAGAAILVGTLLVWRRDSLARLLVSVALLLASAGLLPTHSGLPILSVVIGFEVALNIAGAAFMGEASRDGPRAAVRFIPVAGLMGIAIGPMLGGYIAAVASPGHMLWVAVAAIAASVVLHFVIVRRDLAPWRQRLAAALALR